MQSPHKPRTLENGKVPKRLGVVALSGLPNAWDNLESVRYVTIPRRIHIRMLATLSYYCVTAIV